MSTVSATNTSTLALETSTANKKKQTGDLDQTDFLALLTTQLKTQDPLSPMDNTQMVAQLAQFSNTTGTAEMNASLKTIRDDLAASRVGDAASWIGRSALVQSDVAAPLPDGSYAGEIALPSAAGDVMMNLIDGSGQILHSETFGAQPKGSVPFAWDGKDADGNLYAGGPLKISVSAMDSKGAMATTTASWAMIGGVQSPAGGLATKLVTSLGVISPEAALKLG
ncbi:MAG TPA: flagellar hook capping FlgD N-terminal domain-containing protein [Sphingomonas sp.]|jgi:flagellar basal-body rod modification protein FlgD|uniref:flagellar hook assembly protein FlgD n=1 Tax=Sphingomonas sp. TaxID=28214 RepID=UPI002EDB1729